MKAWLGLRHNVPERIDAFASGLKRLGYAIEHQLTMAPEAGDIMVSWNRMGQNERIADEFERRGCTVLIAENAYTGNAFAGDRWYALSRSQHNGAGSWQVGGPERWDSLGIELMPWRTSGETVLLPQRSMGPQGVAMPQGWTERKRAEVGGRVRPHPGVAECVPLQDDLAHAGRVWTWGSGAAIKALTWGIPAYSDWPKWIGQQDNSDAGRLAMFRSLIWAQATLGEIASGEALERLIRA